MHADIPSAILPWLACQVQGSLDIIKSVWEDIWHICKFKFIISPAILEEITSLSGFGNALIQPIR